MIRTAKNTLFIALSFALILLSALLLIALGFETGEAFLMLAWNSDVFLMVLLGTFTLPAIFTLSGGRWFFPNSISNQTTRNIVFATIVLGIVANAMHWTNTKNDEILLPASIFIQKALLYFTVVVLTLKHNPINKATAVAWLVLLFYAGFVVTNQFINLFYPGFHSTLYPWFLSAGGVLTAFAIGILKNITQYKKSNVSIQLSIGRLLFALNLFWMYLWFSQYLLIWYGNIPHETHYFICQLHASKLIFYGRWIIGFIVPFGLLLTFKAKTHTNLVRWASLFIVSGQILHIAFVASATKPAFWGSLCLQLIWWGIFVFHITNQNSDE